MFSFLFALSLSWENNKRPAIVVDKEINLENKPAVVQNIAPASNEGKICSTRHVCEYGETLASITKGDPEMVRIIYDLNRHINPQLLHKGDVIYVPKQCDESEEPVKTFYMDSKDFEHTDMKTQGSLILCMAYMFNYRRFDKIMELKQLLIEKHLIEVDDGVWEAKSKYRLVQFIRETLYREKIISSYELIAYKKNDRKYFFVNILDKNRKVIDTYNPFGANKPIGYYKFEAKYPFMNLNPFE